MVPRGQPAGYFGKLLKINKPVPGDAIRLVIFDLDGTLVDSRLDLANSVNGMLRQFGRPELPMEVIASYIGDGAPMLVRRALGDPDDEQYLKRALEFFLAYYREHKLDHTYVYPGVLNTLEAIRHRNGRLKMAVLTNKPVVFSQRLLAGLGLARHFAYIYGGNSFEQKKPDPVGVHKLMKDMNATAESTLIVGDSDTDVLTGQNAGVWTCGVTYGIGSQSLEETPPDLLLGDLRELPPLLDGAGAKAT